MLTQSTNQPITASGSRHEQDFPRTEVSRQKTDASPYGNFEEELVQDDCRREVVKGIWTIRPSDNPLMYKKARAVAERVAKEQARQKKFYGETEDPRVLFVIDEEGLSNFARRAEVGPDGTIVIQYERYDTPDI